jgi:DHA2 family multidrug resistance protein
MAEQESLVEYGARRVIVTITAVFCALLEIIDTTIVNVALPNMRGSLGATLGEVSWVITAYAIANVIIVPMTSWLSQQFGRRNYFAASVMLFTVASFLCGNSTGIVELIFFRFIQGLGGGALLVTSQTIIIESYPPEKRAMGQAIYVLGVIIGPTLGPPLGGYIVDHYSWPFIFYINLPVGIVAALLTLQFVRSPKTAQKRPVNQVDWIGIFLLAISVGSLQYILEKGQEDDWFNSNLIITLTITAALGFYCFIWRETVYRYPVVELKVLRHRNLQMGVFLSFVQGFGLFGSTFIIPLYTQSILHWDAFQSGMLMIPSTLMVAFMMPIIGNLIQRGVPEKFLIATGMTIFFFYSLMTYKVMTPQTGAQNFFWPLMVRGTGLGLLSVPISTMALSTLKGVEIGQGAAFSGMMRQLGGSFGVALISTYLTRDIVQHRSNLVVHLNVNDPAVQNHIMATAASLQAKGMTPDLATQTALQMMDGSVTLQATILSYMDIFLYVGILFLSCVPLVLLFIKKAKTKVSMAEATH